jgi:hypothetical protein
MLGRLEMDVDECISAYTELLGAVSGRRSRLRWLSIRGHIAPQFDSSKLKKAIQSVIVAEPILSSIEVAYKKL